MTRWQCVAALVLAACSSDPCDGVAGACLTLSIRGDGFIDQLDVVVSGAFSNRRTHPAKPLRVSLPTLLGLSPPAGVEGDVRLDVTGFLDSNRVGTGAVDTSLALGSHTHATLTLSLLVPSEMGPLQDLAAPSLDMTPPPPLPSGLVDWWGADGNGVDSRGGLTATLLGSAGYAPGVHGQAFSLAGNGSQVVITPQIATVLNDNFTIAAWVKKSAPSSPNTCGDWIMGFDTGGWALLIGGSAGCGFGNSQLYLTQVGVNGVSSNQSVVDTKFHHVAMSKQGGLFAFYVDGVKSTQSFVSNFSDTSSFALGASPNRKTESFTGLIDELQIYNRVLNDQEVGNAMVATAAP